MFMFVTDRIRSMGKVMFSQTCAILFSGGGGCTPGECRFTQGFGLRLGYPWKKFLFSLQILPFNENFESTFSHDHHPTH